MTDFSKILNPGQQVFVSEHGIRRKRTLYPAIVKSIGKIHIVLYPIDRGIPEKYRLNGDSIPGDHRYASTLHSLVEYNHANNMEYLKQEEIDYVRKFQAALEFADLDKMPEDQFHSLYIALRNADAYIVINQGK
jgi:hypothetical protein